MPNHTHRVIATITQISLGWSMSLSHPPNLRSAALRLHLMAKDLSITVVPHDADLRAMRQLLCGLCKKLGAQPCECDSDSNLLENCPLIDSTKVRRDALMLPPSSDFLEK